MVPVSRAVRPLPLWQTLAGSQDGVNSCVGWQMCSGQKRHWGWQYPPLSDKPSDENLIPAGEGALEPGHPLTLGLGPCERGAAWSSQALVTLDLSLRDVNVQNLWPLRSPANLGKCAGWWYYPKGWTHTRWSGLEVGEYPLCCREEGWEVAQGQGPALSYRGEGTRRSNQPSRHRLVTAAAAESCPFFSFFKSCIEV